jgi:peroxiredoxin
MDTVAARVGYGRRVSTNKPVRSLVVAAVLALGLSACRGQSSEASSAARDSASDRAATEPSVTGEPSPTGAREQSVAVPKILDFSAETVTGEPFEGSTLAGKPAVLWFWAPWCPTCRGQIEGVAALVDTYGAEVSFVGVGSLDGEAAIAAFADDVPADLPHLLDPDGEVWRHFGVVEQSTFVVLDAESEVVSEGYLDDTELADLVSGLAG